MRYCEHSFRILHWHVNLYPISISAVFGSDSAPDSTNYLMQIMLTCSRLEMPLICRDKTLFGNNIMWKWSNIQEVTYQRAFHTSKTTHYITWRGGETTYYITCGGGTKPLRFFKRKYLSKKLNCFMPNPEASLSNL